MKFTVYMCRQFVCLFVCIHFISFEIHIRLSIRDMIQWQSVCAGRDMTLGVNLCSALAAIQRYKFNRCSNGKI